MTYQLWINLQERASLSLAQFFWQHDDVKGEMMKFFSSTFDTDQDKLLQQWKSSIDIMINKFYFPRLPSKFNNELLYIIQELGKKIFHWYHYINYRNKIKKPSANYIKEIHWTPYGTINEAEIIRSSWIANPELEVAVVYNMACDNMLENCINVLWKQKPIEIIANCYGCKSMYKSGKQLLLHYWKCRRISNLSQIKIFIEGIAENYNISPAQYFPLFDPEVSINEKIFCICVHECRLTAVKYFWRLLTEEIRYNIITDCTRIALISFIELESDDVGVVSYYAEKYIEMILFFLHRMQPEQKEFFFSKILVREIIDNYSITRVDVTGQILKMLLCAWPWENLVMPVFYDMVPHVADGGLMLSMFANALTEKMIENYRLNIPLRLCKYRSMFCEAWPLFSAFSKRSVELEQSDSNFISNLIKLWDLDSIQMIFHDPEIAFVKMAYIHLGANDFILLLENDRFDKLDEFIEAVFITDEEKAHFRRSFNWWFVLIMQNKFDLVEKLLNWQYETDEGKRALKNSFDHTYFCKQLINMEKYDIANLFLDWTFETTEEARQCKRHFINDECTLLIINKLWCNCGSVEEAIERSNRLLHWFLDSEEEIVSFKRQKVMYLGNLLMTCITQMKRPDRLDDFLKWCSLTEEEIKQIKEILSANQPAINNGNN